ncbi:MAG: COX15/CtaA family protein [Planctomycetota bacterium]
MTQGDTSYSRGLHVACLVLACAILPLLVVGAGVTTKGAGMAFPDWPTSDGYLVNPPNWTQQEDTLWEHGHRLIGWVVGMLAIGAVVGCFGRRGIARIMSLVVLGAIIVQGVMGGLRVTEVSTTLAMIHGVWGQMCFALACLVALVTSRAWLSAGAPQATRSGKMTQRLSLIVMGIILLQLIFGGILRHFDSSAALAAHLVWLIFVCFAVGWLTLWNMGRHLTCGPLVAVTQAMAVLLSAQLIVGSFTFMVAEMNMPWSPFWQWMLPSAHVALGAMILATAVMVVALSFRMIVASGGTEPSLAGGSMQQTAVS